MLCDKHVIKMVLESTQMLCTVSHILGGEAPYKQVHQKHPCTLWTLETKDNYHWHMSHALALACEYTFRYKKQHKCLDHLHWLIENGTKPTKSGLTPFAQAMPDKYKNNDPVKAYRDYYLGEKAVFAKWDKGRQAPDWWNNEFQKLET